MFDNQITLFIVIAFFFMALPEFITLFLVNFGILISKINYGPEKNLLDAAINRWFKILDNFLLMALIFCFNLDLVKPLLISIALIGALLIALIFTSYFHQRRYKAMIVGKR